MQSLHFSSHFTFTQYSRNTYAPARHPERSRRHSDHLCPITTPRDAQRRNPARRMNSYPPTPENMNPDLRWWRLRKNKGKPKTMNSPPVSPPSKAKKMPRFRPLKAFRGSCWAAGAVSIGSFGRGGEVRWANLWLARCVSEAGRSCARPDRIIRRGCRDVASWPHRHVGPIFAGWLGGIK